MGCTFRSDEYRNHFFGRRRVGAASKKLAWLRKALHEIGLLAWGSGALGAPAAVTGLDMVTAANGHITASYTFLDPQKLKSGGQNYATGIASRVHLLGDTLVQALRARSLPNARNRKLDISGTSYINRT
jgi:hypothetical protein